MQFNIGVIGGGIIGLTSAISIQNNYSNCNVTIITDQLSPSTTADGSAGLWMPYLLENTADDKIIKWSKVTYDYFYHLWRSGLADEVGVSFVPCITFITGNEPCKLPSWLEICHGVYEIPNEQIEKFSKEHKRNYKGGFYFTTFTCEPVKLLPYLMNQFLDKGGKVIQRRINTLAELRALYGDKDRHRVTKTMSTGIKRDDEFDIIINCCGISARDIVPDSKVRAIRGQVARIRAPWIFHVIMSGDHYVIPNQDSVVLGGTHQEDNYSTEVNVDDSKNIFKGCYELVAGLKTSPVIKEWVGLRPGRDCVRLELEIVPMLDNDNGYGDGSTMQDDNIGTNVNSTRTTAKNTIGILSPITAMVDDDKKKNIGRRKSPLIVIHNYGHGGAGVTLSWGCAIDVTDLVGVALKHLTLSTLLSLSSTTTEPRWRQYETYNIRSHI